MAEPNTTSAGDAGRHGRDRSAPSHQPGSRLRQALEIARRSTAESTTTRTSGPTHKHAAQEPAESPTRRSAPPAAGPETAAVAPVREPDQARQVEKPLVETWETSTQGWVKGDDGSLLWRPISTTADRLDHWEIATYLGIASGQAHTVGDRSNEDAMAQARRQAIRAMVADAVARGAHGVVGVVLSVSTDEPGAVVTASGTAVTLQHRR